LALVLVLVGWTDLPAHAAPGYIEATWGLLCTPIVSNVESPASGPLTLIVSVTGNDETHLAYRLRFMIGDLSYVTPDAWRFDAAGCQASLGALVEMNPMPGGVMSKTCPAFKGNAFNSIEIKDYRPVSPVYPFPETMMQVTLYSTYPAGNTTSAAQRYHLGTFRFDHTFSVGGPSTPGVSCGGFDGPILLHFRENSGQIREPFSSYFRHPDGMEVKFGWSGQTVTVNGSLPALETTWGHIKSAYRR
jgi:hypothetical protein